jgi:hypothetical protein
MNREGLSNQRSELREWLLLPGKELGTLVEVTPEPFDPQQGIGFEVAQLTWPSVVGQEGKDRNRRDVLVCSPYFPARHRSLPISALIRWRHPPSAIRLEQNHQITLPDCVAAQLNDGSRVVREVLHPHRVPLRVQNDGLDHLAVLPQVLGCG